MDILKRSLAPLTSEAWEKIDSEARSVLKGSLSARKVVDVSAPQGWQCSSIALGKLGGISEQDGVSYGSRLVLPMIEFRVPFTVKTWELDDISRGDTAPDFSSLQEAARKAAIFEDQAVYFGLTGAGIKGMTESAGNAPVVLPADDNGLTGALAGALETLENRSVSGPYALVCGPALWKKIVTSSAAYPLRKRLESQLELSFVRSPFVNVNLLCSIRGGDSELTIGQDMAIGYQDHSKEEVKLFFTETFTFRVLTPESVIPLQFS